MELKIGGRYCHHKGREYIVIGVARDSDTLEELVVYQALYDSQEFGDNARWVRSKEKFLENIMIDGKARPRFKFIE